MRQETGTTKHQECIDRYPPKMLSRFSHHNNTTPPNITKRQNTQATSPCLHPPKMLSSFSTALLVQMQNRPRWPPGASCSRDRRSTEHTSTPGRLRNARLKRRGGGGGTGSKRKGRRWKASRERRVGLGCCPAWLALPPRYASPLRTSSGPHRRQRQVQTIAKPPQPATGSHATAKPDGTPASPTSQPH